MKFKKGDHRTHLFKLPIADYTTGGTLYFAAKEVPDNDVTDAAAVINKSFTDADVTTNATHAIWTCAFDPDDISGVNFEDGEDEKEFKGEFQWVEDDGTRHSYPDNNSYIQVIVYADIKRGPA